MSYNHSQKSSRNVERKKKWKTLKLSSAVLALSSSNLPPTPVIPERTGRSRLRHRTGGHGHPWRSKQGRRHPPWRAVCTILSSSMALSDQGQEQEAPLEGTIEFNYWSWRANCTPCRRRLWWWTLGCDGATVEHFIERIAGVATMIVVTLASRVTALALAWARRVATRLERRPSGQCGWWWPVDVSCVWLCTAEWAWYLCGPHTACYASVNVWQRAVQLAQKEIYLLEGYK